MNAVAARRQLLPRRQLRLGERAAERRRAAHDLAGRLHLGPENRVDAREPHEREHRRLDEEPRHLEILVSPSCASVRPIITPRRHLRERHAGRLREVRHRARRARVHLEHVDRVVLDRELRVHQADDLQRARDPPRVVADQRDVAIDDLIRRDHAGAVAGVDARLLDVLHDAADDDGAGGVRDRVHVELDGILEELVDQDRMPGRGRDGGASCSGRARPCRRRSPWPGRRARTTAARPAESRSSAATLARFLGGRRDAARRLRDAELPEQLREALAILGEVDRVRRRAEDADARRPAAAARASAASARRTGRRPRRRRRPPAPAR